MLMIEHVMQAVMSLAEQVYVLDDGRIIAAGRARPRSPPTPAWSRPISGHGAARAAQRLRPAAGAAHA